MQILLVLQVTHREAVTQHNNSNLCGHKNAFSKKSCNFK